ncbi:MAG: hypothetical protein AAFV53_38280 [Myxococcota bacterium]
MRFLLLPLLLFGCDEGVETGALEGLRIAERELDCTGETEVVGSIDSWQIYNYEYCGGSNCFINHGLTLTADPAGNLTYSCLPADTLTIRYITN